MAKRGSRKKSKKRNIKNRPDMDLVVISLIILSMLFAVLIYTNAGAIGKTFSPILGGLIGGIKYVLPIAMFFMAISMAKEKDGYLSSRISKYLIFIIAIACIMHIYNFSHVNLANDVTYEEIVTEAYNQGVANHGGGAVGAIIASPLTKLLGSVGATILCIGVAIISGIYILGLKPMELLLDALDRAEERKAYMAEEREAYLQEREERRNRLREERMNNRQSVSENSRKQKNKQNSNVELIQDEIVINNLNDEEVPKKSKFSLFKSKNFIDDDKSVNKEDLLEDKLQMEEVELSIPKKEDNPNELNNIFKEVQEVKEEKTKAVLQLEHYTHTVEVKKH